MQSYGLSHRFLGINQYSGEVMCLAQGHITVPSVRIKPRTSRFGIRRSATTPSPPPRYSRNDRPKHFRQLSPVEGRAAEVVRFGLETAGTRLTTKPYPGHPCRPGLEGSVFEWLKHIRQQSPQADREFQYFNTTY